MKKLGLTSEDTVFTQSSCPDELNHDNVSEDLSISLSRNWGEVFHIGGLAGVPFTGKTGWGAFSHHVPDDGNIVLLFAPHVGVTEQGHVGKVHRHGQDGRPTTACGASIGAYNALKKDDTSPSAHRRLMESKKKHDFQQEYIVEHLKPYMNRIESNEDENSKMAALAFETYGIAERFLEQIIGLEWMGENSKFVLLGGIMINVDGLASDFFLPLQFELRNKDGTVEDLMKETYGEAAYEFARSKKELISADPEAAVEAKKAAEAFLGV